MSFFRHVSKKLGKLRQFRGFQSSLVNVWGDPKASKMAGLQGVLLGMGALIFILCDKICKAALYSTCCHNSGEGHSLLILISSIFCVAGNPLLDISAVVDQALMDKYGVSYIYMKVGVTRP